MTVEWITGLTAIICLLVAATVVTVYRRRFPWRTTPAGRWVVVAFTLLGLRHAITLIDTWATPPIPQPITDGLIAAWNVATLTLYLVLLTWMVSVDEPNTH